MQLFIHKFEEFSALRTVKFIFAKVQSHYHVSRIRFNYVSHTIKGLPRFLGFWFYNVSNKFLTYLIKK